MGCFSGFCWGFYYPPGNFLPDSINIMRIHVFFAILICFHLSACGADPEIHDPSCTKSDQMVSHDGCVVLWPKIPVNVFLDPFISAAARDSVEYAVDLINLVTCKIMYITDDFFAANVTIFDENNGTGGHWFGYRSGSYWAESYLRISTAHNVNQARYIATHELLHALGLLHDTGEADRHTVMWPTVGESIMFQDKDVSLLKAAYCD